MGETFLQGGVKFSPQRRKAALVLFAVTLIWGGTFIWMKQALNALEVELAIYGRFPIVALLVSLRFLMAIPLLLLFFPSTRKGLASASLWRGGILLGSFMLIGFVGQMLALNDINPSTSAFLTSLYVVMTALLTVYFSDHKPRRVLYFGVAMATIGAGFIEGPPHLSWGWGEILTVICAFFFALHIVFTQRLTMIFNPLHLTLITFIFISIGSLLMFLFSTSNPLSAVQDVLARDGVKVPLVLLGVGGSFLCLVALNLFQRHMHPVQAAIIYAFEPVWATVFGLGLGLVDWTWWIFFGGGILLCGNLVVELTNPKDEIAASEEMNKENHSKSDSNE